MIVVVDTNIVFSGILSPKGTISDLLLNSNESFEFFAPSVILHELEVHNNKLLKISGLSENELTFLKWTTLRKIQLIDLDIIAKTNWLRASALTKDVDEFDTPFIALSLELESFLWTGDKKLKRGLEKKGIDWILNTESIKKIRNKN